MKGSRRLLTLLAVSTLVGAFVFSSAGVGTSAPRRPPLLVPVVYDTGFQTFEPTLGLDRQGNIFFSTTPNNGPGIGWTASTARSTDHGKTFTDVGPKLGGGTLPPETNDPEIYVDPATGRVFQFHMSPILTCSVLSWSVDQGDSWTTNPRGCAATGVWDHQTMVSSKPRLLPTAGYPRLLTECVNAVYADMCGRSDNGGFTWDPAVPAYQNDHLMELCGAQSGHLAAAPDGTLYLPTPLCGDKPTVYVSTNDGLTWTKRVVANMSIPFVDPSVSIDSAGNVYCVFIDPTGQLYFSVSRDQAATWTPPVKVTSATTTADQPVIAAGDPGKIAIAFVGTKDLPQRYQTPGYPGSAATGVRWGGYLTISTNALAGTPKFHTINATGSDPLVRGVECTASGRCNYQVDFIDLQVGPDGRPYAAFADGCRGTCATDPHASNVAGLGYGVVASLKKGPRLCTDCWMFRPPA